MMEVDLGSFYTSWLGERARRIFAIFSVIWLTFVLYTSTAGILIMSTNMSFCNIISN